MKIPEVAGERFVEVGLDWFEPTLLMGFEGEDEDKDEDEDEDE